MLCHPPVRHRFAVRFGPKGSTSGHAAVEVEVEERSARDLRRRKPVRKMARKRAQQRWSALLVRILRQVQLEGSLWADFVAHANRLHKPAFIAAFEEAPVLECVWPVGGSPCGFCVDLASSDAFTKLGLLHLDHEQDVVVTCDLWKRAMPSSPVAWDDGVWTGPPCSATSSSVSRQTRLAVRRCCDFDAVRERRAAITCRITRHSSTSLSQSRMNPQLPAL